MNERKRRWFQVHLSTAVLLMFVAGMLLWANMRGYVVEHAGVALGWPWFHCHSYITEATAWSMDQASAPDSYNIGPLIGNLIIALMIIVFTAFAAEFLICRREADK